MIEDSDRGGGDLKPYIVFEGFDGTGKTSTICRVRDLVASYNPLCVTAPSWGRLGTLLREELRDPTVCQMATPFLFVADQLCAEAEIIANRPHVPVLLDRHVLVSGPSYNQSGWSYNEFWQAVLPRFSRPSDVFVLWAPAKVIQARLEERRETVPSVATIEATSLRLESYAHLLGPTLTIDTSVLSEEEVADLAVSRIITALADRLS